MTAAERSRASTSTRGRGSGPGARLGPTRIVRAQVGAAADRLGVRGDEPAVAVHPRRQLGGQVDRLGQVERRDPGTGHHHDLVDCLRQVAERLACAGTACGACDPGPGSSSSTADGSRYTRAIVADPPARRDRQATRPARQQRYVWMTGGCLSARRRRVARRHAGRATAAPVAGSGRRSRTTKGQPVTSACSTEPRQAPVAPPRDSMNSLNRSRSPFDLPLRDADRVADPLDDALRLDVHRQRHPRRRVSSSRWKSTDAGVPVPVGRRPRDRAGPAPAR